MFLLFHLTLEVKAIRKNSSFQIDNFTFKIQEIRMEMFQDHALSEDGDEGNLLQQALDEDSDDEDILVTAI